MPRLAEHTPWALLDDGQLDAEIEKSVGGLARVGFANGDLAFLTVADGNGDVWQGALHLFGGRRRGLPEHRSVVQIKDG
jgi:hypothetical protein